MVAHWAAWEQPQPEGCEAISNYPPALGYWGYRNPSLSIAFHPSGKASVLEKAGAGQPYPMMYARTMSWISRKVSPTFLFLTSTIRGVSYSKRKEDTLSMHFCPMAAPGLCLSLRLLAAPWAGLCPPLRQLLCLQRKKKEIRMLSAWLCAHLGCRVSSSAQG